MTVCVLSVPSSFVAVAGASTRSYTLTSTHVVVVGAPAGDVRAEGGHADLVAAGVEPAVVVEYVTIAGPFCGVAGVVVTAVGAPPSTLISTLVSVEPIRSGIRSGRSFGSGTLKHDPPLTVMSARFPSVPPVHAADRADRDGVGDRAGRRDRGDGRVEVGQAALVAQAVGDEDQQLLRVDARVQHVQGLLERGGVVRAVRVAVLGCVLADVVVEATVCEDDRADRRVPVTRDAERIVPAGRRHVGLDGVRPEDHEPDVVHGAAGGGCVVQAREERLLAGEDLSAAPLGLPVLPEASRT